MLLRETAEEEMNNEGILLKSLSFVRSENTKGRRSRSEIDRVSKRQLFFKPSFEQVVENGIGRIFAVVIFP